MARLLGKLLRYWSWCGRSLRGRVDVVAEDDGRLFGERRCREALRKARSHQALWTFATPVSMNLRNWNCRRPLLISSVRNSPAHSQMS